MDLGDILEPEGVFISLKVQTKKLALQNLSARASELTRLPERLIFDSLMQRESLGSTGMGKGIAIPHAKLQDLNKIHCLFARLERPIDFASLDDEPVDLIFLLLAPEHASGDHLKALAKISRLLREATTLEAVRMAHGKSAIYAILTAPITSNAA